MVIPKQTDYFTLSRGLHTLVADDERSKIAKQGIRHGEIGAHCLDTDNISKANVDRLSKIKKSNSFEVHSCQARDQFVIFTSP